MERSLTRKDSAFFLSEESSDYCKGFDPNGGALHLQDDEIGMPAFLMDKTI